MAMKGRNGRVMAMPAGVGWGIGGAAVLLLTAACSYAWMIGNGKASINSVGYVCMAIQFCAAMAGSLLAWRLVRHNRLAVTGAVCGGLYALLLVLALAFGGGFQGMGTTAIMIGLGGVIWQIPWLFGGSSGGRKGRKRAFR